MKDFKKVVQFIRDAFDKQEGFIPLHEPRFVGNEKAYILDAIDSTFVSSVGQYVDLFEREIKRFTGASHAVACVNGTAALHTALILAEVQKDDLVITQPLSFIATCNAISYLGAEPLFLDIDRETLSLCPSKLEEFLYRETSVHDNGFVYHIKTGRRLRACVPMHTFGHPGKIDLIKNITDKHNIILIEDSAESLGSSYKGRHTGTFGKIGVYSFNGNKTITCGGGGMLVTDDENLARLAKHITTQAKLSHMWEFNHDRIGYNYRLPNLNAAFGCAQLENLNNFIENKRALASLYELFFEDTPFSFVKEPQYSRSNYWLNSILFADKDERDEFLAFSNGLGVMTRPSWTLMHKLPMFEKCLKGSLEIADWVADRLVNIPSSVRLNSEFNNGKK